jgi:hypothetical protein
MTPPDRNTPQHHPNSFKRSNLKNRSDLSPPWKKLTTRTTEREKDRTEDMWSWDVRSEDVWRVCSLICDVRTHGGVRNRCVKLRYLKCEIKRVQCEVGVVKICQVAPLFSVKNPSADALGRKQPKQYFLRLPWSQFRPISHEHYILQHDLNVVQRHPNKALTWPENSPTDSNIGSPWPAWPQ